ncbi:MAG: peptidoglycan-binding protein, partial [Chryseobacterium sp.]|uniref:peptidoglycan-binding protein n=1 Tax=Chryseobacterium sp. TaxID=1871047 RepID=UPI002FC976B1
SLHFNCFNKNARGVEVCYKKSSQKGHAERLSQELALAMGIPNRGAKYRADLYMMNIGFDILVEVCFHDNKEDLEAFKKYRHSVVDVLACDIEDHLGIKYSKFGYERAGLPGKAQWLPKTTISKKNHNPKDILRLQKFFIWLGYSQKITKKYDKETVENILRFQSKYNLTKDGVFGEHCINRAKKIRKAE